MSLRRIPVEQIFSSIVRLAMAATFSTGPTVIEDLKNEGRDLLANEHNGIQSAVLHKFEGNKAHALKRRAATRS